MSGLVSKTAQKVNQSCQSKQIKRDKCSASLKSAPYKQLIIDMDCEEITRSQTGKKCDYVFICEDPETAWVVPIELKGGRFKGSAVAEQLQDGINLAGMWIPRGYPFQFCTGIVSS